MSIDFFFFFRFQQNLPLRHIAVLNKEKGSVELCQKHAF